MSPISDVFQGTYSLANEPAIGAPSKLGVNKFDPWLNLSCSIPSVKIEPTEINNNHESVILLENHGIGVYNLPQEPPLHGVPSRGCFSKWG